MASRPSPRCSACDATPSETCDLVLLPCLHALCTTCLAAERREAVQPRLTCVFRVDVDLACGASAALADDEALLPWHIAATAATADDDEDDNDDDTAAALARVLTARLPDLVAATAALDATIRSARARDDVDADTDVKLLADQRDGLLVVLSHVRAAVAVAAAATGATDRLRLGQRLRAMCGATDALAAAPMVRHALVDGRRQLRLGWQARKYEHVLWPSCTTAGGTGLFSFPTGVVVDEARAGDVVVADSSNKRVVLLGASNRSGVGWTTRRCLAAGGFVTGVAFDACGRLWAAVGSELVVWDDVADVDDHTVPAIRIACERRAWGIDVVLTADDVALVVSSKRGNTVHRLDRTGRIVWTATGAGFDMAMGVACVPEAGVVVACDKDNHRLQLLDLHTGALRGCIGSSTTLNCPTAVAYDHIARRLLVGEAGRVSVWSLDGDLIHHWGYGHVVDVQGVAIHHALAAVVVTVTSGHRLCVF